MMFLLFPGRCPHVLSSRRASRTTDTYGDSRNQYLFHWLGTLAGRTAAICTGSAFCHCFCTGSLSAD